MDAQPKTRKESKKSAKDKKSFYSARYARQKVSLLNNETTKASAGNPIRP